MRPASYKKCQKRKCTLSNDAVTGHHRTRQTKSLNSSQSFSEPGPCVKQSCVRFQWACSRYIGHLLYPELLWQSTSHSTSFAEKCSCMDSGLGQTSDNRTARTVAYPEPSLYRRLGHCAGESQLSQGSEVSLGTAQYYLDVHQPSHSTLRRMGLNGEFNFRDPDPVKIRCCPYLNNIVEQSTGA